MADAGDDDGAMRTVINITAVVAIIALLMMAVWLCIRCKQAQQYGGTSRPKKKGAPAEPKKRTHGSVVQPSAEMDRRFGGDEADENFVDLEKRRSSSIIGRMLKKPSSEKLSLSRHDSAQESSSWEMASAMYNNIDVELQPTPQQKPSDEPPFPEVAPTRPPEPQPPPAKPQQQPPPPPPPPLPQHATRAPPTIPEADEEEEESEEEEDYEEEAVAEEEDGEKEFWFYVDYHNKLLGPLSPNEMRKLYLNGVIGHSTRVSWHPVVDEVPLLEDQDLEDTAELREICGYDMPPFMDAKAETSPKLLSSPPKPKQKRPKKRSVGGSKHTRESVQFHDATSALSAAVASAAVPPPADNDHEFWFYVDPRTGALTGPLTPASMRTRYQYGAINEQTRIIWRPHCDVMPSLDEQNAEHAAPLIEVCTAEGPPFMHARADEAALFDNTRVKERLNRARGGPQPPPLYSASSSDLAI